MGKEYADSEKNKTAPEKIDNERALWNGKKYTDPKKAIEYLNNDIKLQQKNAVKYNNRGTAYYGLGEYQLAIEDYNKAISLKKGYADAYNNRAAAYYSLGKHQLAIEDCNKAIKLKKDFVDAYANRALIYLKLGNKDLGCADARKACELGMCGILEKAKNKGSCPLI